jgi:pentatricopeptide repeat protein
MNSTFAASTRDTSYDQTYVLLCVLVLIFALSKVYTVDYMEEVRIVALPMLAYLIGQSSATARRRSFASQIKESSQPELTLKLFDDKVAQGAELNQVAFDRAARASLQLGEVDRALQVREDATQRGLILSSSTYHALVRACAAADRTAEALDLFESMQEECIEPGMNAYYDAIRCYVRVERLETAVLLYKELAEASMPSCSITYRHLSNACRQRGWTEMAEKISADVTCW